MKLDDTVRVLAEATARLVVKAEEIGLADIPAELTTPHMIRALARVHVELCDQVRALREVVDLSDPTDPVAIAVAKISLPARPLDVASRPRLVREPKSTEGTKPDELTALYCRVMQTPETVFMMNERYVVRQWDGMDGCWTDCTGEVDRGEALQYWAEKTGGGTHHVAYSEIDYYRIFPGGTRMMWDGSEGREMHR